MEQNIKACQSINWWCSWAFWMIIIHTCIELPQTWRENQLWLNKNNGRLGRRSNNLQTLFQSKLTSEAGPEASMLRGGKMWEECFLSHLRSAHDSWWWSLHCSRPLKNSLRPHLDMVAILLQRGCQSCNCPVKVEPHCRTGTRYHCRASVQKIQRLHLILALGLDFIKLLTLGSPELWKGTMVRYPKTFRYKDPTLWFASLPSQRHMEFAEAWGFITQIWAKIPRKYCGRTQTKFL